MIELNVLSMYQLNNLLFYFFISFLITFLIIPITIKLAFYLNIFDVPDGKLKKQEKKIPYLGGIAIFLGFFCTLFISILLNFQINFAQLLLFFLGSLFLVIIGFIDDLYKLNPLQKISGQIFSSIFFIFLIFLQYEIYYFLPFYLLWLLTSINGFNLIDVMDGLATTVAIFCSFSFFIYSLIFGKFIWTNIIIMFLGSLFAFLFYNKPPAKIYLGDAGSLLIGGIIGIYPFLVINKIDNIKLLLIPFLILGIPFLELLALILIRFYKKIPFYLGSPDHFSIYLLRHGWSKNSILIYISTLSFVLFSFSFLFTFNYINTLYLFIFCITFLAIWVFTVYKNNL